MKFDRSVNSLLSLLSVLLLVPVCLVGCRPRNEFKPPPPPEVSITHPIFQPIVDTVDFTGTTSAFAHVEIRSRVNGYLHSIEFEDGTNVKKDDLLFVIEQQPFKTALRSAKAESQHAQAELELARANLRRSTQLAKERAVAEAQVDVDKAELITAEANLEAANAAVEQAELNLSYTEIRAPISGRIGRHLLDVGNLVHSEQDILAIIETIDPIYATFYVSESELLGFMEMLRKKELPDPDVSPPLLFLKLENEKEFTHRGKLDFRELGIDPDTGTVLRRGIFENKDQQLIPGLSVRIRAPIGKPLDRLMVEERAIGTDQRGSYLLIVDKENHIEYRPVELGVQVGNMRVIRSGLKEKENFVVNGLQRARPGAEVTPKVVEPDIDIPPSRQTRDQITLSPDGVDETTTEATGSSAQPSDDKETPQSNPEKKESEKDSTAPSKLEQKQPESPSTAARAAQEAR